MNTSPPPIAALATPPGRSALAIIRITGDGAHEAFANIIIEKEKFTKSSPRKIELYTVINKYHNNSIDTAEIIDEITAIKYTAPQSFTGENMIEIFCHGGTIIPRKILDKLFASGAHPAAKGEFARRAWVNGKMNLLKAESIISLIDSQTEKHLVSAQLAYQGKQLKSLESLKHRIINILSDIESRIEFAEDDDVAESQSTLIHENKRQLESIIQDLQKDLHRSNRIKTLDDGVIIAIAGPPNAGKSSLFNEILGYDRSIVHDKPGTTRDAVSEKIIFDGVTVKLFDCAGIRDTADTVEQRGIERTMSAIKDAHFVLWVTSAEAALGDDERDGILRKCGVWSEECMDSGNDGQKMLVIINKIDICSSTEKTQFCRDYSLTYIETSLTQNINNQELFELIKSAIHSISESTPAPEFILNDRHRRIISSVISSLQSCAANFDQEEISAHYLRTSLNSLAEFLGHITGDEVLNEIFDKFCIGK
jgi:tRNA modification GTPase